MIDIELMRFVMKALRPCTRIQMLCAAVLGLERTWQIFLDWTKNESAPLLRRRPEEYREPFRRALDLLVEQVRYSKSSTASSKARTTKRTRRTWTMEKLVFSSTR